MRSEAVFVLSTACLFASVPAIDAQIVYNGPEIPSRFSVGADFAVSQPKGEFATAGIPTGYGFDVTGLYKIDPNHSVVGFSIRHLRFVPMGEVFSTGMSTSVLASSSPDVSRSV